ncbi:MAG TPA: aromatic ring-hydroxylating dioxygenase subunit alpha [Pseudonocardiaceae bacterium]|jgi:phenylpropionate dioxygenase-like ring-hydroxylating dioxygenase large terminal subunit|nr:aromatic ring-hydroxylating dioxygenase subunit alpha [Pseudonocardiaceae bacterium]
MAVVTIRDRTHDIAGAAAEFDRATTLPAAFYLDPDLYRVEEQRVMRAQWLPLARAEHIAGPGDYLATRLLDEQLVIVRDQDGTLRVLSNVCRHRAMPLVEGKGSCRVLKCPYHLWSYRLDGTLSGAPMMAENPSFDRAAVRLPEVRHEVWQGWIMVNLDGAAAPLGTGLSALSDAVDGWNFTDLRVIASQSYEADWNWKITVENFCEYYHHLGLHRDSLEPFIPARAGWCLDNDGEPWNSSIIRCAPEYLELQGPPMSGVDSELAELMQIFTVFPFLCAGSQGGSAFWLNITPHSVNRHVITWYVLVRPDQADDPGIEQYAAASLKAIDVLQHEDGLACKGVQAGLRGTLAAPGRFAPLEKPIWQFQRWLLDQMADR